MLGEKLYFVGFDNVLVYKDGFPDWEKRGLPVDEGRRALSSRLTSPWLTARVQFVLAAIFVVAGFGKILDPPGFAHEIYNYKLVPGVAVNALAIVLPWIEVVAGLALFVGVARRSVGADLRRAPDRLRDRRCRSTSCAAGPSTAGASAVRRSRRPTRSVSAT